MELDEIKDIIRENVISLVTESMAITPEEMNIADDDSLIDGGYIDSLSIIQLIELCQMKFDIYINPAELSIEHWDSINKITKFVQQKLNSLEQ